MHFRQPVRLLLSLLALTILVTACTLPIRLDPQALKSVSIETFADQLRTALIVQDYDQLQQLMGSPFVMADWQAERKTMPPAVAIVQLRNQYLSTGSAAEIPAKVAWRELLGESDPLTLWGPDVPAVKALYITGLSADQQDEALLIVAQKPDGAPYWHSMVVAPGGFRAKMASKSETATAIVSKESVNESATTAVVSTVVSTMVSPVVSTVVSTETVVKKADLAEVPVAQTDLFPRLTFNAGATAATVRGIAAAQTENHYLVRVLEGQRLMIAIASTTGQATFTIRSAEDGKLLNDSSKAMKVWEGTVAATQDYQITVEAPATTPFELVTNFDPRQAPIAPAPAPTRLVFAAGADTMTLSGNVAAPEQQRYLVRGVAGRTLQITLTAATKGTTFAVQGVSDGKPFKRLETTAKSWSGALPLTQDYLITVTTSGAAVEYTLDLSME